MTAKTPIKVGGLLLAAGSSSRLGRPKQLVLFQGETLIRRAAKALINSACSPVVVVLGAETELSSHEIANLGADICINTNWRSGMSSSIRSGLLRLLEMEPYVAAVVIALCDQPRINSGDIANLISAFTESHPTAAAAKYGEIIGVPAVFSKNLFRDLLQLEGDKGAKNLIGEQTDLISIQMDNAAFDIDTVEDIDIVGAALADDFEMAPIDRKLNP